MGLVAAVAFVGLLGTSGLAPAPGDAAPPPASAPASTPQSGAPLRDPSLGEPATAPPGEPPEQLTWDDIAVPQRPAPPPTTTTTTVEQAPIEETERPIKRPTRPTDLSLQQTRRSGNGMLIGAGSVSALGLVLNGLRIFLVTGPCQTASQSGCSAGWFLATPFTWGANAAAIGLAFGGGRNRGEADGWLDEAKQARRTPTMLALGIPLIGIGIATSITFRALWIADYNSPEGPETFDFALPGHAFAYYGAQQASAMFVGIGAAMLSYQAAGRQARARASMVRPVVSSTYAGLSFSGRF